MRERERERGPVRQCHHLQFLDVDILLTEAHLAVYAKEAPVFFLYGIKSNSTFATDKDCSRARRTALARAKRSALVKRSTLIDYDSVLRPLLIKIKMVDFENKVVIF